MLLTNNRTKDRMIPVPNKNINRPVDHITVRSGETVDIPKSAIKAAKAMGLVEPKKAVKDAREEIEKTKQSVDKAKEIKATKGQAGNKEVETKQIDVADVSLDDDSAKAIEEKK